MDALERLTNLVALLLETRRPLTFEQIVDELAGQYPDNPVARRSTFERDKALLRSEGVPLRQKVLGGEYAGQSAYWIDRNDFELTDVDLTPAERRALQMALATVHLGASWGEEAWWKLERAEDEPLDGRVPIAATLPVHDALPVIHGAIRERCEIRFGYRGRDRRLQPYGLLARDGQWYVAGLDVEVGERRTFRLDRFDPGEVTCGDPGAFERPAGFRPADAFPADARLVGDGGDGPLRATVVVDAPRAIVMAAQGNAGDIVERRGDGSVVFDVPCVNRSAFRSWLFDLGASAEVLGPPEMRDEVIAWLRALADGGRA